MPGSGSLFPALDDDAAAGRLALSFPDRSLTYGELRAATAVVAAAVAGRGRVAVVAENRLETCVAVIGALAAGVPVVPLNPKSGAGELAHIVADAAPEAVLAARDTPLAEALRALPRIDVDPGAADAPPATDAPSPIAADPESTALIVYTSGTTGRPKGALMPRRAIASNLDALAEIWAWTAGDVVVHGLPLFHVHGLVIGILGPIRRAGRALHLGRFEPAAAGAALAAEGTMLFGVPTMYRRLAAATGREVLERYGMTETLMNTGVRVGGRPAPGTVGPPLPGVEVRLLDDDRQPIEVDDDETIGELQVRGPNVFSGYLNRPDATAEALSSDGWFTTGDMATRGADGYVRLVGRRATDLIKSGGYKIGAGEIEGSLREHPAVQDAAVTAQPDADLGERIVAWVVLEDTADGDARLAAALVDHVAADLAPHKRPRVVHFLAELPRNALGKVQKARLAQPSG
jgi:malonyl-CoA/methylmalonyl-CoA synthetase